jgi:hypothetical protein
MSEAVDTEIRWPSALAYARLTPDGVETWHSSEQYRAKRGYQK